MVCHGGAPLDKEKGARDLVHKLFYGAVGKAISQLYTPNVPEEALRVMLLRWKVPGKASFVEKDVRSTVESGLRTFLTSFFPNLDVHLVSSRQSLPSDDESFSR